jgi:hypothetical protein
LLKFGNIRLGVFHYNGIHPFDSPAQVCPGRTRFSYLLADPGEFTPELSWIAGVDRPGAKDQRERSGNSHGGGSANGHCLYRADNLFRGGTAKELFLVWQYSLIEYRHRIAIPADWR